MIDDEIEFEEFDEFDEFDEIEMDLPPEPAVVEVLKMGGHYEIVESFQSPIGVYSAFLKSGTETHEVRLGISPLRGEWNLWSCSEHFPDEHWEAMQPELIKIKGTK